MKISHKDIEPMVRFALQEDVGSGDITAELIAAETQSSATVISREAAIICGIAWFDEVLLQLDKSIAIDWQVKDGDAVAADQILCHLQGPSRTLLTGERTALNFLQTLSATATKAHAYAIAVKDTGCKILDTRKTIPGLRVAQKYAVHCGGCYNHRMGLFDAILIKENHILASGSISAAVKNAQALNTRVMIEVEVETLTQLEQAIAAGAQRCLLDNMDATTLSEAVKITAGRIELEASGGITLENVRSIAKTGVDFISTGELTKHIQAVDLSMRFVD